MPILGANLIEDELSKYVKREKGLRHECVFSSYLFNLYNEVIQSELEVLPRFSFGGHNFNNSRYSDTMNYRNSYRR